MKDRSPLSPDAQRAVYAAYACGVKLTADAHGLVVLTRSVPGCVVNELARHEDELAPRLRRVGLRNQIASILRRARAHSLELALAIRDAYHERRATCEIIGGCGELDALEQAALEAEDSELALVGFEPTLERF